MNLPGHRGGRQSPIRLMRLRAVVIVAASVLTLPACGGPRFIDHVTIVNETPYPARVAVTGHQRNGWLLLTNSDPQSMTRVQEIIDQGGVWIFRFDYMDRYTEEIEISRRELERQRWRIAVPTGFEQRLRDMGVLPPPS